MNSRKFRRRVKWKLLLEVVKEYKEQRKAIVLFRRILVFWSRGNQASFSKGRPTQFYIADIIERWKGGTLENQPHAFTDMYFLLLYFYFILLCFIFALFRFNHAIYFPLER